jgi:hypothetical protein
VVPNHVAHGAIMVWRTEREEGKNYEGRTRQNRPGSITFN